MKALRPVDFPTHGAFGNRRDFLLLPHVVRDFVDAFDGDERGIHVHGDQTDVGPSPPSWHKCKINGSWRTVFGDLAPHGAIDPKDSPVWPKGLVVSRCGAIHQRAHFIGDRRGQSGALQYEVECHAATRAPCGVNSFNN